MDRYLKKKRCSVSIQQIGLILVTFSLFWTLYLFSQAKFKGELRSSDYLKNEIIKLSREYVKVLSKEEIQSSSLGSSDSKQTALLLQSMLDRIDQLEVDLQYVIINSTKSFASMKKVLKKLNDSILKDNVHLGSYYCELPSDLSQYPQCRDKVNWMHRNWKSEKKFASNGVNGTVCSILSYLNKVEHFCPAYDIVDQKELLLKPFDCVITESPNYPQCLEKIIWLKENWRTEPVYRDHGVDGTVCSIVKYLTEVEIFCPSAEKWIEDNCTIPDAIEYKHCGEKVAWMRKFWKSDPCYKANGVDGSLCSFLKYLSEVEQWCPLSPGQSIKKISVPSALKNMQPDLDKNVSVDGILKLLKEGGPPVRVSWLTERIKRLWPNWFRARENLRKRVNLKSYNRKKILIYIGLLADESNYHFAELATRGGPLGEFVQWSDVIASLYLLGHQIKVVYEKRRLSEISKSTVSSLCPNENNVQFDIVYTDYIGVAHILQKFKSMTSLKCHLRVVDSFGTEAPYNFKMSNTAKNLYGNIGLNLKQYNTMFPHSPDNSFLGFVVEHYLNSSTLLKKKPIALVYGKDVKMWQDRSKIAFLDIVNKYFEVHATVGDGGNKKHPMNADMVKFALPNYVHNHGVLKGAEIQELLKKTKVFVGIGFPYEGPAPLEAIANGCFFINAKLIPPIGRKNSKFFKNKPTDRVLTSQHPFAEKFIGLPYVYTIDLKNMTMVEQAMIEISNKSIKPYLPFEFTYEGMLERLYVFTKHHDFCNHSNEMSWPPKQALHVVYSDNEQSCEDACAKKGLVCEPDFFPSINNENNLNAQCVLIDRKASLVAPYIGRNNNGAVCILQNHDKYFSCVSKAVDSIRVCPCRDYVKGQTALCEQCLI